MSLITSTSDKHVTREDRDLHPCLFSTFNRLCALEWWSSLHMAFGSLQPPSKEETHCWLHFLPEPPLHPISQLSSSLIFPGSCFHPTPNPGDLLWFPWGHGLKWGGLVSPCSSQPMLSIIFQSCFFRAASCKILSGCVWGEPAPHMPYSY